jgi:hypothetical protein
MSEAPLTNNAFLLILFFSNKSRDQNPPPLNAEKSHSCYRLSAGGAGPRESVLEIPTAAHAHYSSVRRTAHISDWIPDKFPAPKKKPAAQFISLPSVVHFLVELSLGYYVCIVLLLVLRCRTYPTDVIVIRDRIHRLADFSTQNKILVRTF